MDTRWRPNLAMSDALTQELWRQFYARLFARALYEDRPEVRQAYVRSIAKLVALSKQRKERHGKRVA
jgi:hypothetical protein